MHDLGQNPLLAEETFKGIATQVHVLLGDQDDMADREFSKKVAIWLPHGIFQLLENTPHPIEKVDLQQISNILLEDFQGDK